ncbi:hypothetical protein GSI_13356 [Ganoderma sinense ZZ0214-1]|uniref:MYND-type domain-containing protein n=1 Tax=Ganoderma sinense ZZ0214-1 TaxID=1077348 RepID=A0A2G8RVC0_9APHY|nr:hypothetical protein GSI_13356 [Ganoderma sinense ZZ0214-1]
MDMPSSNRQQRSFHVEIHECDPDEVVYDKMGEYASLKYNCCFPHDNRPEMMQYISQCSRFLGENPSNEVGARIDAWDPEAFLEMGFRYLSGCGVRTPSIQGALFVLDTLTMQAADVAPAALLAQGHSAAAYAHWQDWCTTDPESRAFIDAEARRFERPIGLSPYAALIFATVHANYSVRLGLVSAAVLSVGFGIKDVVEQLGADVSRASPRFMPLWDALKEREDEVLAEERRRQGKVAKEANAYVCAAEGCKVGGMHKAALRSCSGRCPPDLKPHYCSKECQRRDWPKHKVVCKPGRVGKPPKLPDDKQQSDDFLKGFQQASEAGSGSTTTGTQAELGGEWLGPGHDREIQAGPELVIEVPGLQANERMRFVSSTLAPTELRKLREEMSRAAMSAPAERW